MCKNDYCKLQEYSTTKLRVKECEHILAQIMTIYIFLIVFFKNAL
jgi:hypothetical protein